MSWDDNNDGGLREWAEVGQYEGAPEWWIDFYDIQALDASLNQSHRFSQGNDMARTSEMIESKYLKQADFPDPLIVTIKKVGKINLAKEGEKANPKWAIKFEEFEKLMVLNGTNIQLLEKACGSDDTDDWVGKEVIVYTDESVSFGGQVVGGLRVRRQETAPTRKALPGEKSEGVAFSDMDDDIPF